MTTAPITQRLRGRVARLLRPTGPPPLPTRRNQAFDVVLALALGILAVRYALAGPEGPLLIVNDSAAPPGAGRAAPGRPPVDGLDGDVRIVDDPPMGVVDDDTRVQAAIVAVTASAALVFRRRYPLAVLWIVLTVTGLVVSDEPRLTFYAVVIAAYSAAAFSPYRLPAIASLVVTAVAVTVAHDSALPIVSSEYVPLLVLVPIVMAADGMHRWKLRVEQSRVQMSELERAREDEVRRAAEEERERIARELHDVVTHNVSVMVIQAGAARKVMANAPDQANEALLAVEAGGRAAMADLRQVMGLLSRDGDDSGHDSDDTEDLNPQPGLDRLQSLVDRVREAGLPVELNVTGPDRTLPPAVELAAYRVVQEALTNTMKHASGASATVTIDRGDDRLRVEVTDTGGTPAASARSGDGRGLIGLRERLAVHDATLTAGRRLTGGYRVEAVIPVEAQ